jgi:guanine deaminase
MTTMSRSDLVLHLPFMRRAIALAQAGMEANAGGPFGCVIVKDGKIVGEGHNEVLVRNDPTAHAEIVAIRAATAHLGHFQLDGCTLYTSCEPCPMCLGAIYWARPERVFFALTKGDAAQIGFDDAFIYRELAIPPHERRLRLQSLGREEALPLLEGWASKVDRTPY